MSEELRDAPPTTSIAEVLNGLRETSAWQEGIYNAWTKAWAAIGNVKVSFKENCHE